MKTNWTAKVTSWVRANAIEPGELAHIKTKFPGKYAEIQNDIRTWGINKVTIGFAQNMRPLGARILLY